MRRLHIDQAVTISLDDVHESIACRVLDVQGSVGRLAYSDELPPRVVGQLVLGSAGYLVFDQLRSSVGLRVAVRASPPYLDVAVIDGVALPERRGRERIKLVTRVQIMSGDGPGAEPVGSTETINLSERGALLRRHPALADRQRFAVGIMFGDDPQPISVQARVVRRLQHALGVEFESIPEDDATRLGEYLMGIRHRCRQASRN